jgi:hypothetical protein
MPTFYRVVKEIDTLFADHTLYLPIIRKENFNLDVISQVRLVNELIGFGEKPSRVQREDPGLRVCLDDHIGECLVFNAEAGRKGDALSECMKEITDDFFYRCVFESLVEGLNLL